MQVFWLSPFLHRVAKASPLPWTSYGPWMACQSMGWGPQGAVWVGWNCGHCAVSLMMLPAALAGVPRGTGLLNSATAERVSEGLPVMSCEKYWVPDRLMLTFICVPPDGNEKSA